jgi:hypothetical protein
MQLRLRSRSFHEGRLSQRVDDENARLAEINWRMGARILTREKSIG